jgi:type IV secretory pathway VirB3-like protein
MLFALITIGVVVVALAAVFTGVWLLPTGGGGAVIGIVILLLSLIILTAIGVMLWLLARGDSHSESRFRS